MFHEFNILDRVVHVYRFYLYARTHASAETASHCFRFRSLSEYEFFGVSRCGTETRIPSAFSNSFEQAIRD